MVVSICDLSIHILTERHHLPATVDIRITDHDPQPAKQKYKTTVPKDQHI